MGRGRGGGMADAPWLLLLLACCCCIWSQKQVLVAADTDSNDVTVLNTLFTSLNSPGQLKGWQASGGDPCGQSWQGITCSGSSVTAIKLPSLGLSGNLAYNMNSMASLVEMDLSFNSLAGDLPQGFTSLSSLKKLYLQNNQFTGYINVLAYLPLDELNVANNRFTGWIPSQLKKINSLQTDGNTWSTGPAPPPPPYTAPPSPNRQNGPGQSDGSSNSGGSSGIGGGGIAGIIISLLVVGAAVAFFVVRRRKHKAAMEEHFEQHQPFTSFRSNEVKDMKPIEESIAVDVESLPSPASISLKPPPKIERHKSFDDDDSSKPVMKKSNMAPIKAIVYSVADLQMTTDSFSMDNLVGEGTFGRVYKAQFNDGKTFRCMFLLHAHALSECGGYLHETCSPSTIHKNFKSSNILLDSEFNPHLSDAGLASFISDAEFQPEPEFRPPMSEVVQALVRLVQRANMTKRMLDGDSSRRADDQEQDFI
ncbi:hypothetical protein ABZP36_020067 [Zizania latifolia]